MNNFSSFVFSLSLSLSLSLSFSLTVLCSLLHGHFTLIHLNLNAIAYKVNVNDQYSSNVKCSLYLSQYNQVHPASLPYSPSLSFALSHLLFVRYNQQPDIEANSVLSRNEKYQGPIDTYHEVLMDVGRNGTVKPSVTLRFFLLSLSLSLAVSFSV